jgi:hypothetical protein
MRAAGPPTRCTPPAEEAQKEGAQRVVRRCLERAKQASPVGPAQEVGAHRGGTIGRCKERDEAEVGTSKAAVGPRRRCTRVGPRRRLHRGWSGSVPGTPPCAALCPATSPHVITSPPAPGGFCLPPSSTPLPAPPHCTGVLPSRHLQANDRAVLHMWQQLLLDPGKAVAGLQELGLRVRANVGGTQGGS